MANNIDGWDGAGVRRVVISFFVIFTALGSICSSGEMNESEGSVPVMETERIVSGARSVQNNVSSEDSAVDHPSDKGGVELDFSGLDFSVDSGMKPRKCGVLIPKIKY